MKLSKRNLSCALAALALSSCHFNSSYVNREEDKADGEKVTRKLYDLLKGKRYTEAYSLFSPEFYKVTDTGKLRDMFIASEEKLGSVQSLTLENWNTVSVKGTDNRSEYRYVYTVRRANYASKEDISLRKEDGDIKILGYQVNSDGFFVPGKKEETVHQ